MTNSKTKFRPGDRVRTIADPDRLIGVFPAEVVAVLDGDQIRVRYLDPASGGYLADAPATAFEHDSSKPDPSEPRGEPRFRPGFTWTAGPFRFTVEAFRWSTRHGGRWFYTVRRNYAARPNVQDVVYVPESDLARRAARTGVPGCATAEDLYGLGALCHRHEGIDR